MKKGSMETDGKSGRTFRTEQSRSFSHEELLKALYHFEDLADSAFIGFFPRLITADCVKHQKQLEGDAVYLSVSIKDMRTRYVYEVISAGIGKTQDEVQKDFEYLVGEVPVKVHVYTDNPDYYQYPDRVIYEYGDFLLPNPWSKYEELLNG